MGVTFHAEDLLKDTKQLGLWREWEECLEDNATSYSNEKCRQRHSQQLATSWARVGFFVGEWMTGAIDCHPVVAACGSVPAAAAKARYHLQSAKLYKCSTPNPAPIEVLCVLFCVPFAPCCCRPYLKFNLSYDCADPLVVLTLHMMLLLFCFADTLHPGPLGIFLDGHWTCLPVQQTADTEPA